jgi:hypothetical protein
LYNRYRFKDQFFFVIILFITLFTSSYIFFKSPFEFYFHYLIFIGLLPVFFIKIGLPKFFIKASFILMIIGLIHVLLGNNLIFNFFKIFGGLFLSTYFFYCLLQHYQFNLNLFFYWYCKISLLICYIGLFQVFSYLVGFKVGYDFSWIFNKWGVIYGGVVGIRVNSILAEPSQLGIVLAMPLYVSVKNVLSKSSFIFTKIQSFLVILIVILTTSSIAYLGLLTAILLCTNTLRLRYVIFGFLIILVGFLIAYNNVKEFKLRADAAKGLWYDNNYSIDNTNNSSFVLYNNLHVAGENLKKHPFFGSGLGSHEIAYKNFTLTKNLLNYNFDFNVKDGNSLFIRLCTETGLVGLFLVLFITFKGFIYKTNVENDELYIKQVISQSIFILLVLTFVRQGNYMLNGLPLMFLIYYFNYTSYKDYLLKNIPH